MPGFMSPMLVAQTQVSQHRPDVVLQSTSPGTTDSIWNALDRGAQIYTSVVSQQIQAKQQQDALNAQTRIAAANARSGAYFAAASQSNTTKWLVYGGLAIVGLVAIGIVYKKTRR